MSVLVIDGQAVGVYLRTSSRRNKDGSMVRYLSIAHNERSPGGPSVAKVLLPLGREDRLDVEALRRLVGSINRYLGEDAGTDAGAQIGAETGGALTSTDARLAGGAWLLDGLWQQLGIGTALREVLGGRRFTTDVERVAFALVANRALAPASKLAAADWPSHDVAIPGLAGMDEDQAYRAMDLLVQADTDAAVQEAVFFIAGERMRAGTGPVEEVLARSGRYRAVRDNLRVKEVRLDSAPDLRWVLCHNPDEAGRQAAQREAALERIRGELARIAAARSRHTTTKPTTKPAARRRESELAAHSRAECALRDHPALGRWLRQTPSGRLVIDTAKIRAEARLDGKYLLVTSDPDLSAEDIALGYKNLLEAERGFRDLKSTLELRPVYHRLEPRIRAHVLLCWLALLLIRVAERRTGQTWAVLARELGRLHAVTLTGPTGTVTQTTELTTTQQGILRACGLTPPPRITALQPT